MINGGGVDFARTYDEIPENIGYRYQASSPRIYKQLRKLLKSNTNIRILDVGCGKGRMVKFFSNCGCEIADGLEYSRELVSIARNNLIKLKLPKCNIYHGNAAEWNNYDKYNWFYMFNPFDKEIMKKFIEKLLESYGRHNRDITVIYLNPKEANTLIMNGFEQCELIRGCSIFKLRRK